LADSEAKLAFCGQVFLHGGVEINEEAIIDRQELLGLFHALGE
jgi:hypothetical protein